MSKVKERRAIALPDGRNLYLGCDTNHGSGKRVCIYRYPNSLGYMIYVSLNEEIGKPFISAGTSEIDLICGPSHAVLIGEAFKLAGAIAQDFDKYWEAE